MKPLMKKTECPLYCQTAVILFAPFAFKSVLVSTYRKGIATYARQKFLTTIWLKILRRITNYSASSPREEVQQVVMTEVI